MTSPTGKQIIKMSNISKSKGIHAVKFGQLVVCNVRNVFQKSYRKGGRETSSRPIFVFKKVLQKVKISGLDLRFNIFW